MKILKSEEVTIQKITIKPQNIWQRRDFKILIPSSNRVSISECIKIIIINEMNLFLLDYHNVPLFLEFRFLNMKLVTFFFFFFNVPNSLEWLVHWKLYVGRLMEHNNTKSLELTLTVP